MSQMSRDYKKAAEAGFTVHLRFTSKSNYYGNMFITSLGSH